MCCDIEKDHSSLNHIVIESTTIVHKIKLLDKQILSTITVEDKASTLLDD